MSEKEHINGEQEAPQEENQPIENTSGEQAENTANEVTLEQQLANAQDKYTRLFAEFDNYKKRTSRERVELIQSAGKDVIAKLLSVLDDFDRALKSMETAQDVQSVKEGIDLVNNKFRKTLEQEGLKEMDVLGQPFDADLQEAITSIPAPSADLKDKVVDVIEKGYYLNDKVIRYAKVVVGK
ncbi:nucleotide exchange factor GrpE [Sphingobacterium spiritivorum]|uniref:Protein GrpE n=2 Tax=Sphingobacterium spiritivorum TaxID=258 RepID=D7VQ45_SPHSI|nr:nucleotide exchange factor GrpE [Sphingobacterium spiritivorum]EFK55896.1 co-chaperone GrpE [Sphingobacterium spiritivorum ATCC 33861]QQT35967.1 nucleotide exchange factor GrpE [Sphingobacterium spiritivorum]WQD32696.1 nucleotide exchange factor GrpE [Sphingobacterium spiritivorum]SUJ01004.1 HSP-70 cofactor [Sphingobacterium spiritivorum]SUJ13857.1 HSP-70 cofactor [Sphingobacterium spiritivorum]